jgi:hypothetical protein
MTQATRRSISEKIKSLGEANVLPLHDTFDAEMVKAALAEEEVSLGYRSMIASRGRRTQ